MSAEPQDKFRQKVQMYVAIVLVGAAIYFPIHYVAEKGITSDDALVTTIITGFWTLVVAGAGAAFSLFGLGRKVT